MLKTFTYNCGFALALIAVIFIAAAIDQGMIGNGEWFEKAMLFMNGVMR